MEQPRQNPPVDRRYMRYVLGKKAAFATVSDGAEVQKVRKKDHKGKPEIRTTSGSNFIVELTVFHLRPNPRRRF
jgi:hypothetical protein